MKKPDHIESSKTGLNFICVCGKKLSYQYGERLSTFEKVKVQDFFKKHESCKRPA